MRLNRLSVLLSVGFAITLLPLIALILAANRYLDGMVRQSTIMVTESIAATRATQSIGELITNLERGARQYQIVGDEQLLDLYRDRHTRLLATLSGLQYILPEARSHTDALRDTVLEILPRLQEQPHDAPEVAGAIERFGSIRSHWEQLSAQVNASIDADLATLQARYAGAVDAAFWLTAGLIPLAAGMGVLFTVLIARAVRQLVLAIHQLGKGDLAQPISVDGPRDLQEVGARLDWLRVRLADLEQEKTRFLQNISHELKTPLANIREGTELLIDGSAGVLQNNQREILDVVNESSVTLQKSIENLLRYSTGRRADGRLRKSRFNLEKLLREVADRYRLAIVNSNLQLRLEAPDLLIETDREKLHVVFDNLISNAVKFSPRGGTLLIRATRFKTRVEILVADEGRGIAEHERSQVFEPFYQGAQAPRGHVRGTGIGLSLVREYLSMLGGTITIGDGELCGANFYIRLPNG